MTDPAAILETRNLIRTVGGKTILDNISAEFHHGRIYTLIGPSGAGKSSYLRLLNRLDEPTSGEVLFHGTPTDTYSPCILRCKVGYLFQTPYMFAGTVRDNLLYAECALQDTDIERLLDLVQLDRELADHPAESMSVGQQQRAALGRLLATKPEILLLDEPTSALDPTITEAIEETVRGIVRDTHVTVVMVTHNPEQALRMTGETLLLVAGKLVERGPCEEVINNPTSDLGKRYRARQLR